MAQHNARGKLDRREQRADPDVESSYDRRLKRACCNQRYCFFDQDMPVLFPKASR